MKIQITDESDESKQRIQNVMHGIPDVMHSIPKDIKAMKIQRNVLGLNILPLAILEIYYKIVKCFRAV